MDGMAALQTAGGSHSRGRNGGIPRRNGLPSLRATSQAKAAVDQPDNDGWTPLNSAAGRGHMECLALLLEVWDSFD